MNYDPGFLHSAIPRCAPPSALLAKIPQSSLEARELRVRGQGSQESALPQIKQFQRDNRAEVSLTSFSRIPNHLAPFRRKEQSRLSSNESGVRVAVAKKLDLP
jgi:hypothetical protein